MTASIITSLISCAAIEENSKNMPLGAEEPDPSITFVQSNPSPMSFRFKTIDEVTEAFRDDFKERIAVPRYSHEYLDREAFQEFIDKIKKNGMYIPLYKGEQIDYNNYNSSIDVCSPARIGSYGSMVYQSISENYSLPSFQFYYCSEEEIVKDSGALTLKNIIPEEINLHNKEKYAANGINVYEKNINVSGTKVNALISESYVNTLDKTWYEAYFVFNDVLVKVIFFANEFPNFEDISFYKVDVKNTTKNFTIKDLIKLAKHISNKTKIETDSIPKYDFNQDDKIDGEDLLYMIKIMTGEITL